jgi:hypothetical protein
MNIRQQLHVEEGMIGAAIPKRYLPPRYAAMTLFDDRARGKADRLSAAFQLDPGFELKPHVPIHNFVHYES